MTVTLEAQIELLTKERNELAKQLGEEVAETQRLRGVLEQIARKGYDPNGFCQALAAAALQIRGGAK